MKENIREYRKEMTEKIIEALKNGTAPWQKSWSGNNSPINAVTGRHYTGSNIILLSLIGWTIDKGSDPRWCTYQQAKSKGWNVKRGSKGTRITFWKKIKITDNINNNSSTEDHNEHIERIPVMKFFTVFHASQIDGIDKFSPAPFHNVIDNMEAEKIIANSGAKIRHFGFSAFYSPDDDFIQVPDKKFFIDTASYYAVIFHEMAHWSGHHSRLNRDLSGLRGSTAYAREELVAEIASMFISVETGIPQKQEHFDNHVAYVNSWISLLEKDHNALFKAISDAEKATDFVLQLERKQNNDFSEIPH